MGTIDKWDVDQWVCVSVLKLRVIVESETYNTYTYTYRAMTVQRDPRNELLHGHQTSVRTVFISRACIISKECVCITPSYGSEKRESRYL